MAHQTDRPTAGASTVATARRLVAARLEGRSLGTFPGPLPADLAQAYACQDAAIAAWPDVVAGWKIGLISPDQQAQFGQARLAGPVFRRLIRSAANAGPVPFPIFAGGFAAVEAEYVFVIGRDAAPDQLDWSIDDAVKMIADICVGVETAGSPLASINDLGPLAIVADFGNNAGLIIGQSIPNWRQQPVDDWRCASYIDDVLVGRGGAAALPGGPFEALRFLLGHCARRGRPLRAGDVVSSGAATGVHQINAGQIARIEFDGIGEVRCAATLHTPAVSVTSLP